MNQSRTHSSYLNDVVADAWNYLHDVTQRRNFAAALDLSRSLDLAGHNPPRPPTADKILTEFGFTYEVANHLRICIRKAEAPDFLATVGYPVNTTFRKRFDRNAYRRHFRKPPIIFKSSQMLLTYAEWLHFVDYLYQPELPSSLEEYL